MSDLGTPELRQYLLFIRSKFISIALLQRDYDTYFQHTGKIFIFYESRRKKEKEKHNISIEYNEDKKTREEKLRKLVSKYLA